MRSPARPFFHASIPVPLTGREPVLVRLRARLQHRGQGWGQVILTGPRGAGISRLIDECERILAQRDGRPVLRVRPAYSGAPPLEPLRQAFLARFTRARREDVYDTLTQALGSNAFTQALLAWLLDGPLVGARAPALPLVRALLRGLQPEGPLLVDDLARLDPASRELVLEEGDAEGIGLLTGNTGAEVGPAEAHWALEPLGETQLELLLRRWLRHPVATRRLTPLLLRQTGGWPGSVVRLVRSFGRAGALEETARGIAVATWPPPLEAAAGPSFAEWLPRQSTEVRHLLAIVAIGGDPDDDHFLARAASVRLGVVADARAEIEEVFPDAAGRLLAGSAERRGVLRQLELPLLGNLARALHRTWSRRREEPEPRAASRASRLRVALQLDEVANGRAALARFVACVPAGASLGAPGRALLEEALRLVPADTEEARSAMQILERPRIADDRPRDVAGHASRHETLAERAAERGRSRARAAHLRRAARLHQAQGATCAAGRAWDRLAAVELEIGRPRRAFDAYLAAGEAHEAAGDGALARTARHAAADVGVELAHYNRAVELLEECLASEVDGAAQAAVHRSLARAHHGRGDLEAERRHILAAGATLEDEEAASEAEGTPAARLRQARRLILAGQAGEGRAALVDLADDPQVGVDLRVEALVRLAHACLRARDEEGAHEAACRADGLLEVGRRSRANDAKLHHQLAVAFRALGEMGRAIRHRRASRTALRRSGDETRLTAPESHATHPLADPPAVPDARHARLGRDAEPRALRHSG